MTVQGLQRPFGQSAWAAPYLNLARFNIGASAVAAVSLNDLANLGDFDPREMFNPSMKLDYIEPGGSMEMRELVSERIPGLGPDNVAMTNGAGDALSMMATWACRPGAHVVVAVPAHGSLLAAVDRSGCQVTLVRMPIDLMEITQHIGPSTTAVFLSSPHNPTGQVIDVERVQFLSEALAKVGGVLVVDEVFRGIALGKAVIPPPAAALARNAITINSLSKVYGLPGIRLGWLAGDQLVVDDVRVFQRYSSKAPAVFSEVVGRMALACEAALLARARALTWDAFLELDAIFQRFPGCHLPVPDGGTAAFPLLGVPDVDDWCARTVEDHGLLLTPGNACFGIPGRVRINLGVDAAQREPAFVLLAQALAATPSLLTPITVRDGS